MGYISDLRKYIGHQPILTAGVGLFVFNVENKVLMQLRTDYNLWGFPGGTMELGESFEEVAIRELKEETNLEGAVGDFYEAIQDDYVHKRTVQVVMYLKNITGDVSISDEHDNWMWANLEKIKTLELSTAFEKVLKKKNWKI